MYYVTKTYGHERGLSCCFRQWRADSHCSKLHGYALAFEITFKAAELDERNWVIDFGSLKELEMSIKGYFDHKLLLAKDDPAYDTLVRLQAFEAVSITMFAKVGCEAFAEFVYNLAVGHLHKIGQSGRVHVHSVKVSEHGSNSATFTGVW